MAIQNVVSSSIPQGAAADGGRVAAPATHGAAPRVAVPETKPVVDAQPTAADLQQAVDSLNKSFKKSNTNVEFSIDRETKQNVVKMVDSKSGEVIRQYPSEVALAISKAIDQESKQGVLLNNKA